MNEKITTMDKRMTVLEDSHNRVGGTKVNVGDCRKTQEDQNQRRAVATGFHEDTTVQEVENLLKETIVEIGMSTEKTQIKCPAEPITHGFLHSIGSDEANKYARSANMIKKDMWRRKIGISTAMDAEERFHQKNWLHLMLHSHKTQCSAGQGMCQSMDK